MYVSVIFFSSTSSVRLDSGQHEELVMDLDPELVKQHVAMRQSENDFQSRQFLFNAFFVAVVVRRTNSSEVINDKIGY